MSKNVIDSLREWTCGRGTNRRSWKDVGDWGEQAITSARRGPMIFTSLRMLSAGNDKCETDPDRIEGAWKQARRAVQDVVHCGGDADPVRLERDWMPQVALPKSDGMVRCRVVRFDGEEAECTVFVDGYELPSVSFPAWVLKRKGLEVGSRFIWIMRDAARVRLADIDTEVSQSDMMTAAEKARLEELYQAFQRRRAEDGGEWPEYTGPGR